MSKLSIVYISGIYQYLTRKLVYLFDYSYLCKRYETK